MTANTSDLTQEEAAMFLEIAEASLYVARREQFFSWLQGSFQYLFPHEVMICGISDSAGETFFFDSFSSTLYPENWAKAATCANEGVVWRVMSCWRQARRPLMLGEGLLAGDYGNYLVPFAGEEASLAALGLHNIAAHGTGGVNGSVSTFFCFSRLPKRPGKVHARLLELFMPYLHSALVRVAGYSDGIQSRQITEREREVLQWVRKGKTNGEIAQILGISLYTVKNHVQNILRKLNVQNRSHAVAKGNNLLPAGD